MSQPKTPTEALDHAIWRLIFDGTKHYCSKYSKPGQLIEHMPDNVRKLLRGLKSDDTVKLRPDATMLL